MTNYYHPSTVQEALTLLANGGVTVAAGCTDLFPLTGDKHLPGDVLDVMGIAEMRGIGQHDGFWRIEAATTWTDLLGTDLPPAFDGLKRAARDIGSLQIQNVATIAGNLCTASPAADGAPCLMTLDASVELQSLRGKRQVPISDFLTGPRQTAKISDELLTAILVPASVRGRGHFLKLGARKYLVISIAMVAARISLKGDVIDEIALAIGACSPTAQRIEALENALRGQPIRNASDIVRKDLVAQHLSPIDDIRGDAIYRIDAATELLRRVLTDLAHDKQVAA